jgi:threonine/homoserine/homoserine lactone efflux protein
MPDHLLSLILFAMVMTFSPGPNNVLMATSGAQVGLRRSVPLGLGIVTGFVLVLVVSAAGLGSLLEAQPSIQTAMKAAGSLYLLWLAWKIAHSGQPDFSMPTGSTRGGFATGFINTMLNPKGWSVAISAAAGYAALVSSPLGFALLLATIFALLAVPNWLLWCGGGQFLTRLLRTNRSWQVANAVLGSMVIASVVPMWLEI